MAPDQRQHWKSGAKKWLTICGVALPLHAAASHSPALEELKNMSFEELMNVEITSVSRHEEPLRDAAAAVAIVTPEIIRRSFVLVPLVELEPCLVHPGTGETMASHLNRLGARPLVKRGTLHWN